MQQYAVKPVNNVQEFQQVQTKRLEALNQAIKQLEKKLENHPSKEQLFKRQTQNLIEKYARETRLLMQQLKPSLV